MKKLGGMLLSTFLMFSFLQPASASSFSDLENSNRFYSEIQYLVDEEIISGFPDNTFRPDATVTRAQASIMIGRTLDLDGGETPTRFPDVPSGKTGSGYIEAMAEMKIIQGFPNGQFRPDEPVTRGQMAMFLSRAFELKAADVTFSDVTPEVKAYDAIKEMYGSGITLGYPDGTFRPNEYISREQFSAFLYRTLQNEQQIEPIDPNEKVKKTAQEIFAQNDEKVVLITTNNAQGSGVIVSDGLVLTNEHVVNGMQQAEVTLNNGTTVEVDGIVEVNKEKDLALIKTKSTMGVTPVTIGDTSMLNIGEDVAAIGSPQGLQNTLSTGIVSSKRTFDNVKHIQTTASITYGSSGGGLFNQYGELIGITTWMRGETGNLNFAVDISEINDWKHYLTRNLSDIPVMTVDPQVVNVVSGISMGMTKEEVKNIATGTLIKEDAESMFYTNSTLYDFPVTIIYNFNANQLDQVFVSIDGAEYLTLDELETLFVALVTNLEEDFGQADYIDANWFDDETDFNLQALWNQTAERSDIFLQVQVNEIDYSSNAGILFTINF